MAAVADLGISMEFDPVVALQEIFPGADPQLLRGYLEASENVLYVAIRSFRDYLASDSATTSAGTSTSGGMADMTAKEALGSPQGGLRCRSRMGACCGVGSPWSSGRTTSRHSSQRRRGTPRSWTRRCRSSTGWTRPTTCSSIPSATSSQCINCKDGRWMPARIRRLRPRHPQGGAATTPDPSAGAADPAWTDKLPLPRRLHESHGCSGAAARVLLRLPHQDDAMEWKQRQGSFGTTSQRGDASSRSAAAAPWMQGRHHGWSPFSSRFLQFGSPPFLLHGCRDATTFCF